MNVLALRLRRPWPLPRAARELAVLCIAAAVTLGVELALVERKYAIIGGGFGQSQALEGLASMAIFIAVLTASHIFLFTLLFLALRWLHSRIGARARTLFPLNFLLLVPGLDFAALAAKYEVLSYFSDAVSFQLIRNLGGGSLFDALLFALSEGALMIGCAAAGLVLYLLLARYYLRRRRARMEESTAPALSVPAGALLLAGAGIAAALYLADTRHDVRASLGRFNAVWLLKAGLDEASDVDRDGFGAYSRPRDSWPFDAARHPYALDVPGNGIDEDGIGGDFQVVGAVDVDLRDQAPLMLPGRPKNLIVIVLESTRFDALGRRFAGREITPAINALAAQGSSFSAAFSHVGFTTASLKSLFSGQLEPHVGGPSLFRDMKANGYRIGVFSGQPESFGDISEVVGMRAEADVFQDAETLKAARAFAFAAKGSLLVDGKILLREFDRSFGRPEAWSRPVFLYFNLQSAHFPYHHKDMEQILPGRPIPRSAIGPDKKEWVAATYWNAVAQADSQVGEIVRRLKALGVYENSLILVTADHGESLFDDGFLGHGHMLNAQQTHIPLVVNVPGVANADPIGLADYRALILRLLGVGTVDASSRRPVLQYIGTLDRPSVIGLVEPGPRWTVLDTAERTFRFSEMVGTMDLEALSARPMLKARADRLIAAWEAERWAKHLRSK